MSDYDKQPFCDNQNSVSTSEKTVLSNTNSLPSTTALTLSFDGENNGFEENSKLRMNTLSEPGSSRRAPVVERSLSCLEWQIPLREKENLLIETDVSNLNWGACCNGVTTRGIWSHQECLQHINCLKLMAGGFAIKSFAKTEL